MSIKKSIFKISNGSGWDEHHFETDSGQVAHTTEDGEQTTVEEELNELNRNLQIKFPSNYHTEYAQIGLAYSTATEMRGNQYFTGKILSAVATLEHTAGTPTSQVDRVIVDCNYGQNGRLEVYAQGAGFVSGHNLIINTIAIIED